MAEDTRTAVREVEEARAQLDADLDALEERLPDVDTTVERARTVAEQSGPAILAGIVGLAWTAWVARWVRARRRERRVKNLVIEAVHEARER